jgi:hypothetical protein
VASRTIDVPCGFHGVHPDAVLYGAGTRMSCCRGCRRSAVLTYQPLYFVPPALPPQYNAYFEALGKELVGAVGIPPEMLKGR